MSPPLVVVKSLTKQYPGGVKAINEISFCIYPGETVGLVGESGSGKSTVGKNLLRLEEPTSGEIFFNGQDLLSLSQKELKPLRKEMQMIFQDPFSSLNPRMNIENILTEPFEIHGLLKKAERKQEVEKLLSLVGLSPSYLHRFPHELSGGQRQRIGIARALALTPKFIVCDEPISSLDVSVRAQIVNLLKKLQQEMGLTYLFIAHDLSMVKYLSHRVAVLYLGQIVELAPSSTLYAQPKHPYTQALLSAIPIPDPRKEKARTRIFLSGDLPSPYHLPKGCLFSTRCPYVMPQCHQIRPELKEIAPGQQVACHLYK